MKNTLLLLLLSAGIAGTAQAQYLDSSFHYTGLQDSIATDSGLAQAGFLNTLALQANGDILVALENQQSPQVELLCFHSNGLRSNSFGTGGRFAISSSGSSRVSAITLQPDSKILFSATVLNSYPNINIYRLHSNGVLDSSFGIAGKINVILPATGSQFAYVTNLFIRPNGKIVACGGLYTSALGIGNKFLMAQYLPNGTPDTSFGVNGALLQSPSDRTNIATCAALQPDGKILMGGIWNYFGLFELGGPIVGRYDTLGNSDSGFGTNGYYIEPYSLNVGNPEVSSLALQSNGKIIVNITKSYAFNIFLKRLFSNGIPDTSFGDSGLYNRPTGSLFQNFATISKVAVLPGDSLLVGCNAVPQSGALDFSFFRVTPNGQTDSAWGDNGLAYADFHNNYDHLRDYSIQPDGKIVACGGSRNTDGTGYGYPSIARFKVVPRTKPNGIFTPAYFAGKLKLYPNPAGNTVHIEGALAGDKVTIWNAMGQAVLVQEISIPVLEAGALPAGLYQVLVQRKGVVVGSGKLVKE